MGGTLQLLFRYRPGHRPDIGRIVAGVQTVFSRNSVDVRITAGADAPLNAEAMESVNTSGCQALILKHRALFDAVAPISTPNEAVVFVVRHIVNGETFSGCAKCPPDCPGLVITQAAAEGTGRGTASTGKWVLAHEIAHVLGLHHVDGDTTSLMHAPATGISLLLPVISLTERTTLESSRYVGSGSTRSPGRNIGSAGTPDSLPPRQTPSRTIEGRSTPLFPTRRRRGLLDGFAP
jgi:hypothetical protein